MQAYSIEYDRKKVVVTPGENEGVYNLLATWFPQGSYATITSLTAQIQKNQLSFERLTPERWNVQKGFDQEAQLMSVCFWALLPLLEPERVAMREGGFDALVDVVGTHEVRIRMSLTASIDEVHTNVTSVAHLQLGKGARVEIEDTKHPREHLTSATYAIAEFLSARKRGKT